jgi:hypothetical protein
VLATFPGTLTSFNDPYAVFLGRFNSADERPTDTPRNLGGEGEAVPDQLHAYIDGWRRHNISAVLATVAEDCVITECYGPVYRGRARVRQWMEAWFAAGGMVLDWQVTSSGTAGDLLAAEWAFTCIWGGVTSTFEGATVARLRADEIVYLREYATSAELYDWTGTWRT